MINITNKKAFSSVELIIVITLTSILALNITPYFERDRLQEAAQTLMQHLIYTQSLAISDNSYSKYDKNYYKKRWQLLFSKSAYSNGFYAYSIFKDGTGKSSGNPDVSELAINPLNPNQLLSGGYSGIIKTSDARATPNMNLGQTYGVSTIKFEGGCKYYTSKRIGFDDRGRPLIGNISKYKRPHQRIMKKECSITLCHDSNCNQKIVILMQPYTGFLSIKSD